jgi:hypothetical protein
LRSGKERDTPPFIFIATNRLKAGKLDQERARVPGLVEFVETNEPRLIAFHVFGQPTETIVEVLRHQACSGVEISVNGEHLGGFTRTSNLPSGPLLLFMWVVGW